ncbi:uncharacterized protein LOC135694691 [Rhopilema esculentum]|uniref:uncharacterized protein LOC135694691 n=1 Tax=Rhopilema esculentum TaxID=499914 RepID=UPI0031CDC485|eukprot:gene4660-20941_t
MALIQAVKQGSIRAIKLVIENPNFDIRQNETGTTALIEACKFGDKRRSLEMVTTLLKNDACICDTDMHGRNALHWACSRGQKEIVDAFLRSNQPLNLNSTDFNGNTVLFHAVSSGDCSFIRFICKAYKRNGGVVETKNRQGMSAVDMALKLGHRSCAALVNRVTGLNQCVYTAGNDELNCCTKRASAAFKDEPRVLTRTNNCVKGDLLAETVTLADHSNRFIQMESSGRRYMSSSTEDVTHAKRSKLPKLTIGNLTTRIVSKRERSKTVPRVTGDLKAGGRLIVKRNFSKGGFMARREFSEDSPNTYKDLLVDFNLICSVEKSPSYRKGFVRPKEREKTKIVTFSDTTGDDLNGVEKRDDTKQDDKMEKAKASRKMSKIHEKKSNSTLLSKKERRKSRKSRDEG